VKNPWITVADGSRFGLLEPIDDDRAISLTNVAAALSKICRFNGHVRCFYSVAEHCVYVSRIVPKEYAILGLLHDAPEAFYGDMSRPWLAVLGPDVVELRTSIDDRVFHKLAIPYTKLATHHVKVADDIMCITEARQLLPAGATAGWQMDDIVSANITIGSGWAPRVAERRFLERWNELKFNNGEDV